MKRLRQLLTLIVLILFSAEILAGVSIETSAASSHHQIISQSKERVAFFSLLTQESENEERADDKPHGYAIDLAPAMRLLSCELRNKVAFTHTRLSLPYGHQRVLKLVGQLVI